MLKPLSKFQSLAISSANKATKALCVLPSLVMIFGNCSFFALTADAYGPNIDIESSPPGYGACQLLRTFADERRSFGINTEATQNVYRVLAQNNAGGTATDAGTSELEFHTISKLPDYHRLHVNFQRLCLNPLTVSAHPGPYKIRVEPGFAWVGVGTKVILQPGIFAERVPEKAYVSPEILAESNPTFTRKGFASSQYEFDPAKNFTWHTRLLDHYFAISPNKIKPSSYPTDFLKLIVVIVEDGSGHEVFRTAMMVNSMFGGTPIPFPRIPIGSKRTALLLKDRAYPLDKDRPNQPIFYEDDPENNCRRREGLLMSFGLLPS